MPDPISVKTTHNPDPGWSPVERQLRVKIPRQEAEIKALMGLLERQQGRQQTERDDTKAETWKLRIERTKAQLESTKSNLSKAKKELEAVLSQ